jgi:hypothetical protein
MMFAGIEYSHHCEASLLFKGSTPTNMLSIIEKGEQLLSAFCRIASC